MDNNMDRYLGTMLDNRYELLEMIGSGGMAVVYKALCHRLNRYVAVKILKDEFAKDEDFCEHFKAESHAVAMLSHPNIVAVYDYSKSSDCQYIVMELLEGITLKQYMQTKGALSWKEALHFSTQITKALCHAHDKGIVHRDIKPQNIMVGKDGSIKVADFGIAHLQSESTTDASEALGSIHYISPEQIRGEPVDARTDIYSLGIVMYEMLTGRLPYEGDTAEAVAVQHFGSTLTLPGDINPDIPLRLEEITLKAMTSDINSRYQSASELLNDLESFRKTQASPSELVDESFDAIDATGAHVPIKLKPTKGPGELSEAQYRRRRQRARKVSTYTGFALIAVFLLLIVSFLWEYWIEDLFVDNQRVEIPNFIGEQVDVVKNSKAYEDTFNFVVSYTVDPSAPEGSIVGQKPEAGRSVIPTKEGIQVQLIISTGMVMTKIPDVFNTEYREATLALEKLGFNVTMQPIASDTVTEGYVVSTNPTAGEELPSGSTIYLYVSGGPQLSEVAMPNVVGKTQTAALAELTKAVIDLGSVTELSDDDYPAGTVIWQSIEAGELVTPHTVVYLKVSTGPREKPTPKPQE